MTLGQIHPQYNVVKNVEHCGNIRSRTRPPRFQPSHFCRFTLTSRAAQSDPLNPKLKSGIIVLIFNQMVDYKSARLMIPKMADQESDTQQLSNVLKAVSDPTRRSILTKLVQEGHIRVTDIAAYFDMVDCNRLAQVFVDDEFRVANIDGWKAELPSIVSEHRSRSIRRV